MNLKLLIMLIQNVEISQDINSFQWNRCWQRIQCGSDALLTNSNANWLCCIIHFHLIFFVEVKFRPKKPPKKQLWNRRRTKTLWNQLSVFFLSFVMTTHNQNFMMPLTTEVHWHANEFANWPPAGSFALFSLPVTFYWARWCVMSKVEGGSKQKRKLREALVAIVIHKLG